MPRPTEADKVRFRGLVPDAPGVEVRPMFGNLGAFVDGAMFLGLFGSDVGIKAGPAVLEEVRLAGGGPYGPSERPMGGWVTLPASAAPERLAGWVAAALAHVASLPPKERRSRGR
jgi:TfoX/Sxy family transcriptional regulator of competence genes